ncbi:hypothetical protein EOM09_08215, partial [bacterium]|nr:hypothetical protein [bacterium]
MEKLIKDIRYYASNWQNVTGQSLPVDVESIYSMLSNSYIYIGQRFALKLREFNFYLDGYDHLYINLTTVLPEHESILSSRNVENWLKFVDYGFSQENMKKLKENEQKKTICLITKKVLLEYCCKNSNDISTVNKVYEELVSNGENTNILFKILL